MSSLAIWAGGWQWRRGVRALVAIGSAMAVCHHLGVPPQAAAIGAFDALLVDNGGPYRPRLATMATALIGGALALVAGCLVPPELVWVVPATLAVCWLLTYARVLSQPVASTSVLILVLYFAGLGGTQHTPGEALASAWMVLAGGAWAVLLSLVLWPLDPFRPARLAVSRCYLALADFSSELAAGELAEAAIYDWQRHQRIRIEEARAALSATAARAPTRTVRARSLTVLLETSDMLLARTMRLTELAQSSAKQGPAERGADSVRDFARWQAAAERAVGHALAQRPADAAESFAPGGSHTLELLRDRDAGHQGNGPLEQLLQAEDQQARFELRVIFEALRTLWTGVERTRAEQDGQGGTVGGAQGGKPGRTLGRTLGWTLGWTLVWIDSGWRDALRANWTLGSANMRHALRLAVVGVVDVIAMRLIHVNHGFWLPMTSIILVQPYSAGSSRKSLQRVTGTIAGGLLAAVLAASVPGPRTMLVAITLLSACTLATFAVDYAVYCFFLTPTFVLMSLPHPHDWRYAGIRMGLTLLGALIAIAAMRLLWPQRAETELAELLRRGATAESGYLRAVAAYLELAPARRRAAERTLLAPARRACGLASNDAEEALDRVRQEPHLMRAHRAGTLDEEALAFTTYLRRLTQSVTTLAPLGSNAPSLQRRLEGLAARLEAIGQGTVAGSSVAVMGPVLVDATEEQMQRIERQTRVLEKTLAGMV